VGEDAPHTGALRAGASGRAVAEHWPSTTGSASVHAPSGRASRNCTQGSEGATESTFG